MCERGVRERVWETESVFVGENMWERVCVRERESV